MSHTHSLQAWDAQHVRHLLVPAGVGTTLAALALDALGVWGDGSAGASYGLTDFLFVGAFILVASALVFGLLIPRTMEHEAGGAVALGLSVLAVVTLPMFWLGLSGVLGVGGALLGMERRETPRAHRLALAGIGLGAVAVVATLALYGLDWMGTHNYM